MQEKFRYLEKSQRKKILLLSDDLRMFSGVASVARDFVIGTAHHFNWVNLGAAINHPDVGKGFDLSDEVNRLTGINDSSVVVLCNNGYGDAITLRNLIRQENPDAIMIFTDPRYWIWLFEIEREIRSKIPLFYLNIWDSSPAPLYNKPFYESCDLLMAISKQTKNINEMVLGEIAKEKQITYLPHGIDENNFYPILEGSEEETKLKEFSNNLFQGKDYKFKVLFNARNIRRKSPGDVILSYRNFCDRIGKEKAKECCLVLHTQPIDENGTDLVAVREALCDPEYVNVIFSTEKYDVKSMNLLYNACDVTMLISSNEGWGLSLTESMMSGKMIIGNVTGGMQDQMRFEDENGNWINFSPEFPSNHTGRFKKCGEWCRPVFPSNLSLVGSVPTPYIFDDRCDPRDVAEALENVYNIPAETRLQNGMRGREWVLSKESGMSVKNMCKNMIESIDSSFERFKPRRSFELHKITTPVPKYLPHPINY